VIGGLPETVQVVGDLDRTKVGAKQMKQDRNTASCHARRFGPANQLLESGRQNRRPSL
jgi:hypothetical protein